MPINYICDMCGTTADSLDGWNIVDVNINSTTDTPQPGSRVLLGTQSFIFHAKKCLTDWCQQAGVEPPQGPAAGGT